MMISRNPFAREELHRERVYHVDSCQWCGQVKQTPSARESYLFKYHVETDSARIYEIPGLYCSVDCMRSYHS